MDKSVQAITITATKGWKMKYGKELRRYENCPPGDAQPGSTQAFRFVHSDIADSRNFTPPAELQPNRTFRGRGLCLSWALSFFVNAEDAKKRFHALGQKHRNIHKAIGSCLAKGQLRDTDGRHTKPTRDGHFSLFESASASLASQFTITEDLVDGAC